MNSPNPNTLLRCMCSYIWNSRITSKVQIKSSNTFWSLHDDTIMFVANQNQDFNRLVSKLDSRMLDLNQCLGIATALTVHAELYKGFEAEEEDMCYLILLINCVSLRIISMSRSHLLLITPIQIQDMVDG
ncbi:hypothetical protein GmHk_09G024755 [Glycine max]|nr:hypothetical protein GmHk_09G024755 [Glycine max]